MARQGSEAGSARVNVVTYAYGTATASIALKRTQYTVQSATFSVWPVLILHWFPMLQR